LTSGPRIAVVVPTRDRCELLLRALDSVVGQLRPDDELLVIDNGSSDGTRAATEQFLRERWSGGRVIAEERRGLSNARNLALREATAPVVAFIDDDERVDPDWLAALRRAWFEAGPRVAGIGGPMRADWQAPRPAWLEDHLLFVVSVLDLGTSRIQLDQRPGTGYLWGGNMSVRRSAALAVGGFPPDHTYLSAVANGPARARPPLSTARSGEEQKLQKRLAAQEWEIWYEPAAAIDHLIPAQRTSKRYFVDFYRQQAILALGSGRSRASALPVLAREATRYLIFHLLRRPAATVAGFGLAGAWTLLISPRPRPPQAQLGGDGR
jgi:glycosyltransferase involved in cell wall biosynthesis